MDIKFDPVHDFQCTFPFFISLVHIWHQFSFGLLFLAPDGRLQEDCRWLPPPITNEQDLT
jgi:hypothetical protein